MSTNIEQAAKRNRKSMMELYCANKNSVYLFCDLTQRIGKSIRRVGGKARDEIHVDIVEPGLARLMEHVHDGRRAVPPPDGL